MPFFRVALSLGLSAFLVSSAPVIEPVAAQATSQFEPQTCAFPVPRLYPQDLVRQCGHLIVPEVRDGRSSRTYRLAVLIYKAKDPDGTPPLLLLHGGPGGDGGTRYQWREVGFPEVRRRDVVIFDMRGVGQSEPRICPDFEATASKAYDLPTRREWEQAFRETVKRCVADVDAKRIDRHAFGSDVSAADAIDLRRALKYETWDVYGVSYGGLVAQELLRLDPKATRAAALISAPYFGPDYAGQWTLAYQKLLEIVAVECRAQPACHALSPDVIADVNGLFEEFSKAPVDVPIPGTVPERKVRLNGDYFAMKLREQLGFSTIPRIPLLLHELRRGNRETGMRRLVGSGFISGWDAESRLIQCNEYGAEYRRVAAATLPELLPPFRSIADDFREHCDLWLPAFTRQQDQRPVQSSAPVLITHGRFEPMLMPATQRRMMIGLARAYAYVFPSEGHAGALVGCRGSIVRQFLADPFTRPDSTCLNRTVPIQYKTRWEPLLTFRITSRDSTPSPLLGDWEVVGGPEWTVELSVAANTVTGSIVESGQPVLDGRADDGAISFRVTFENGPPIVLKATLKNDTLVFTREVEGGRGRATGPGLFGGPATRTFVATRVKSGGRIEPAEPAVR